MSSGRFNGAWLLARTHVSRCRRVLERTHVSRCRRVLPAVAVLTACSGIPLKERQDAQRAQYESYAGPPVGSFTWLGRYDSWQSIGTNEVVVWTTPSQAYLIKVAPPCDNLQFANRIGLTSTASTVSARFDFVKVHHWRCPIQQIRPVDYQRMRQDMRKEAEAAKQANGT